MKSPIEYPSPPNTRRRRNATAQAHRENAAAVMERLETTPTQIAVNAENALIQDSPRPRRGRSNIGNDPLSFDSLRNQNILVYERCDFTCAEKGCEAWAVKNAENPVNTIKCDSMGHARHVKCTQCSFITHSRIEALCYKHLKTCTGAISDNDAQVDAKSQKAQVQQFVQIDWPRLAAKHSLSTDAFLKFVAEYEALRPSKIVSKDVIDATPSAKVFHRYERRVADKVWALVNEQLDRATFFGMAVDGGVDTVLHEHVLIAILYVGRKHFVLPPIYHPKHKGYFVAVTLYSPY